MENVETLLNDNVRLCRPAHSAVRKFRSAKPWRGTFAERLNKFNVFTAELGAAYGLSAKLIFAGTERPNEMGDGLYDSSRDAFVLLGKLSVVTTLHVVARARGYSWDEAVIWSLSVFKRMFPISWGNCHLEGPFLVHN